MPILGIIASSKLAKTFISTIVTAQTNFIAIPWVANAFGTKFSNPATTPPTNIRSMQINFTPDTLSLTNDSTPFIGAYAITASAYGSKYSDPSPDMSTRGSATRLVINSTGDVVVYGNGGTPYWSAYAWSGSGYGTQYSDPATALTGPPRGLSFNSA